MAIFDILLITFQWILLVSFKASILIGLILFVQLGLRHRLPAKWRYILWMIIIVRLMIPFGIQSKLSLFNLFLVRNEQIFISPNNESEQLPIVDEENYSTPTFLQGELRPVQTVSHKINRTLVEILGAIWLFGVFGLSSKIVLWNVQFWRKIRRSQLVDNLDVLNLFTRCKKIMRISTPIELVEVNDIKIPIIYGVMHSSILIPNNTSETLTQNDLKHVFLHELAHQKRKDVLMSLLFTIIQVVHWFNPVIWYAMYRMRRDREFACDALALSKLNPKKSHEYGQTILSLLSHISHERRILFTVGILETKNDIKRRLAMIANYKKPSLLRNLLALVLVAAIGCGSLTEAKKLEYSVILDPGHGGKDFGAVSSDGFKEKDFTLSISKIIKAKLEKTGISVFMTRKNDRFLSFKDRLNIKNKINADLLISIHNNSYPMDNSHHGITIWHDPDDKKTSLNYAVSVGAALQKNLPLKWNGIRAAPYLILKESLFPALMIHIGYFTNIEDLEKIRNPAFQEMFAAVLTNAIRDILIRQD